MNSTKVIRHLALVSALTVSAVYFFSNKEDLDVKSKPLVDISVEQDVFVFNPEFSYVLNTREGSTVYVDANSFERSDGSALKGNVEVSFKEYHNIMDVIKSRIKMTYDSSGVKYHLQSAGMFEITGKNKGKTIKLKKGKKLKVDLLTKTNGGKFNFYKFENNKWKFLHKDASFSKKSSDDLMTIEEELIKVGKRIEEIKLEMPIKPSPVNHDKINIKIDFSELEFPELAGFKDVLFEFVDDKMNVERFEEFDWDFVEINKKETKIYQLSVYSNGDKYVFDTKPVIKIVQDSGTFAKLFNKYQEKLLVQKGIEKSLNVKKMTLLRKDENKRKSRLRSYISLNAKKSKTEKTRTKLIRSFQISSFGMFNSDCPANLPEGPMFVADFKATDGDSLKHNYAYLVEKNTKRLFTYYPQTYSSFRCNPKSENMIVILTDSNRIYACNNEAFKGVAEKVTHKFDLDFKEIDSESELSIKKELNF